MAESVEIEADLLERVTGFLGLFAALAQKFQLYGRGHPRTEETWSEFEVARDQLVDSLPGQHGRLAIAFHEDRFYFENVPLPKNNQQAHLLREHLAASGLGGFVLTLTLPDDALERVLTLIARSSADDDAGDLPEEFRWIEREEVHRLQSDRQNGLQIRALLDTDNCKLDEQLYPKALERLSTFASELTDPANANVAPLKEISEKLARKVLERPEELLPHTTIPYYTDFFAHHGVNCGLLALAAARLLTDDPGQLAEIALAALLHDCGEALVPADVLHKSDPLTADEISVLQGHAVAGAEALERTPGVPALAVAAAYGHHVKPPGGGYPPIAADYEPGPVTQLVAVVDIFEALTAFRPHKRALTAPHAFARLAGDPALAALRPWTSLLAQAIGFHPVGSRVRRNDGRLAIVCDHESADPLRPIVRLVDFAPEGIQTLPERHTAVAADLPWFEPPDGAATVEALDTLTDLDLLAEPAVVEPATQPA